MICTTSRSGPADLTVTVTGSVTRGEVDRLQEELYAALYDGAASVMVDISGALEVSLRVVPVLLRVAGRAAQSEIVFRVRSRDDVVGRVLTLLSSKNIIRVEPGEAGDAPTPED
ncbi:MAG: hypothetical protein ACOCYB_11265 [Alkalispirochaeta sp.]